MRDHPAVVWLALAALTALAQPFVPGATWLMVHLVLLGALTHSAMVWSTHFTQALLKTPTDLDDRRQQNHRLALLALGTTLVLVGVPSSVWMLTLVGASLVAAAVTWHGIQLWRRLRRALPGRFRITIRYYLGAAAMLVAGAALGATLARGWDDQLRARLLLAHSLVMLLGWLGLTVTGTLLTLWPTVLRTKMDVRAEALARQALPALVVAVVLTGTAAALGQRLVVAAGLLAYAAGLAWWGRALVRPARTAPPKGFTTWSIAAALIWFAVVIAMVLVIVLTRRSWTTLADGYDTVAVAAAVGFGAQILSGALSYLVPTVIGGGPIAVRAGQAVFDTYAVLRLVLVNGGLVICLLPVPPPVRIAVSALVFIGLVSYLALLLHAIGSMLVLRKARDIGGAEPFSAADAAARVAAHKQRRVWSTDQFVAGIAVLALVTSVAGAVGRAGIGTGEVAPPSLAAGVAATGDTTTVRVEARDMRFSPSRITMPAGNRLVIDVVNVDPTSPHDLTFSSGAHTPRLMLNRTATLDVGVVGASAQAWCSVLGHRQLGMVLDVVVTGRSAAAEARPSGGASAPSKAPIRLGQMPPAGFRPVGARLPALTPERVHHVTLTITEVDLEVAPGVHQLRWAYNGQVPGPTLHGQLGDTFVVTLVNRASMGHSIDFHAGDLAPDVVMRTIPPGASLTYTFVAHRAGAWLYHCSTMPMSAHIAAGQFGAVVIEPEDLAPAADSYVLVQSEAYVDGDGTGTPKEVDAAAVAADQPDAVSFNGIANQYDAAPLVARVGGRVRIWVVDAGPNHATSFHVVGSQFDTVWSEGAYLLRGGRGPLDPAGTHSGGAQALALQPGQGGFVELSPREPGHYPFVSHVMVDAERGAHGILEVTP
ncbi:MAG: multicopper oxidase domain-containing protein [Nostocoides sp.]